MENARKEAGPRSIARRAFFTFAIAAIAVVAFFSASGALTPRNAQAAQFIGVYAPVKSGSGLAAWARLDGRPYSGSVNTQIYMKIESREWWGWQYLGGRWVTGDVYNRADAWTSVTSPMRAGHQLRTTVEIYYDAFAPVGGGATVGPVSVSSNGQVLMRYKVTWSSWTVQF